MDDLERKIKELKSSVDHIGDLVLWSVDQINNESENESRSDRTLLKLVYGNLNSSIQSQADSVRNLEIDLKYYFDRQSGEVTAILRNTSVLVDTVKAAVKNDAERDTNENDVARRSDLVTQNPVVTTVNTVQPSTGMSVELQKKLDLVLDSAAGFFDSWGNPVEVGAALTLPIVGALGIAFGGVVLTVNKLVDGITDIIGKVTDLPSGIIGAVGGAVSSAFSSKNTGSSVDIGLLNSTILTGTKPIVDKLTNIDGSIRNLKIESAGISVSFDPIIKAIESSSASISSALSSISFGTTAIPVVENKPEDDLSFKNRVITLLENPVPVEVIVRENRTTATGETVREDVFASAVRPLVRNQEAMYSMLSSNLMELNQAVATLKSPPEAGREDRITRLNDSVNMTVNEGAIEMILEETRTISRAILNFRTDFGTFADRWNTAVSEKRNDRAGGETVLSGD